MFGSQIVNISTYCDGLRQQTFDRNHRLAVTGWLLGLAVVRLVHGPMFDRLVAIRQ